MLHLSYRLRESRKGIAGRAKQAIKEVYQFRKSLKIAEPKRPLDTDGARLEPVLPPDLTALSDEELGMLHGQYASMAQYATHHLAVVALRRAVCATVERRLKALARIRGKGKHYEKAAQAEIQEEVQDAVDALLVEENSHTLTEAILQGYLIGRDATSREMTRRYNLVRDQRS